jgi:hypothetical protein
MEERKKHRSKPEEIGLGVEKEMVGSQKTHLWEIGGET